MDERGIDDHALFRFVQQRVEEAKMTVTTANAVTRAILVQHEELTRTQPTL